jgi:hypothetical protein
MIFLSNFSPHCYFIVFIRFFCEFSDEFMFTPQATLRELAIAVKHGGLTESQLKVLEESNDEGGEGRAEVVEDAPLCPWFTCCS